MRRNRSTFRRATAVGLVLAVHLLLAWVFVTTAVVDARIPVGEQTDSLELVPVHRSVPLVEPVPQPERDLQAAPPTGPNAPGRLSSFVAAEDSRGRRISVAVDATAAVDEDIWFDARSTAMACAREYPNTAWDLRLDGAPTLLVKVEPSGRPSELTVVEPSVSPDLDAAVGACVMALGVFAPLDEPGPPRQVWRRVRWPSHVLHD